MQLRDHALGQFTHALRRLDLGARKEGQAFFARETRMHATDEIHSLADAQPAWQHGDVGDEANLLHQLEAMRARIQTKHGKTAVEFGQSKNRLKRRSLSSAIGTDQTDDPTGLNIEID